jgi:hypothetical protein
MEIRVLAWKTLLVKESDCLLTKTHFSGYLFTPVDALSSAADSQQTRQVSASAPSAPTSLTSSVYNPMSARLGVGICPSVRVYRKEYDVERGAINSGHLPFSDRLLRVRAGRTERGMTLFLANLLCQHLVLTWLDLDRLAWIRVENTSF